MATVHQSGMFYFNHPQSGSLLTTFPKDMRRSLLSRFDPRFSMIFFVLALFSFAVITFLSNQKVSETVQQKDIEKIQERYAQLVLNQPKPITPKIEEVAKPVEREATGTQTEATTQEKTATSENETYVQKEERREVTRAQREEKRAQVSKQVASSGIFAAITAVGSGGGGGRGTSAVSDFLGAASEGLGDIGGVTVSKGTFATRQGDGAQALQSRRSATTAEVGIQKSGVGRASSAQLASAGSVNLASSQVEIVNKPSSGGDRSAASIQEVVNRESKRLIRVYEEWLKRDPELNGKIEIKFTILSDGSVTNVSIVKSTTNNSEFDQNILRYVKRWQFAGVSGSEPYEVIYPFVFSGVR